ncbi:MAG: hypothetical protein ACFFEK_16660 [Candidatus Thorarchaeota archaeon]
MTQKSRPSEILGVFFIFVSPIPAVFFAFDFYPWGFPSFSFFSSLFSPDQIFLLYSTFIMIFLGWCLTNKEKWAKEAAILFTIVSILMSLFSFWLYSEQAFYSSSRWIESLIWMLANILFLGVLLSDYPLNSPTSDESSIS